MSDRFPYVRFDGSQQVGWSASTLDAYQRCPVYHNYTATLSYRPRGGNEAALFGSAVHAALQHYDAVSLMGTPHDNAIAGALQQALHHARDLRTSNDTKRTPETLARTVVWYFDHFASTPLLPTLDATGEPIIERSFEVPIGTDGATFGGRVDKIASFEGAQYIVDHKTTGSHLSPFFWDSFAVSNQVRGYTWACRNLLDLDIRGFIINAMQVGVGFTRFGRSIIPITDAMLVEWKEAALVTIDRQRSEVPFHNFGSCSVYGGCRFRPICSRDPSIRQNWIDADFEVQT